VRIGRPLALILRQAQDSTSWMSGQMAKMLPKIYLGQMCAQPHLA
jgi:hypothetical protein